ncbi:MAG: hypothetical protein R3F59_05210 [Myxococcota bacterium]
MAPAPAPPVRAAAAGIVPVEAYAVATGRPSVLRLVGGVFAVAGTLLLGVLSLSRALRGDAAAASGVASALAIAALVPLGLAEPLSHWRRRPPGDALALGDGRRVALVRLPGWSVAVALSVAGPASVLVVLCAAVTVLTDLVFAPWLGLALVLALFAWIGAVRRAVVRFAAAVHRDPPDELAALAARPRPRGAHNTLSQWGALARLFAGDAEGAERELQALSPRPPTAEALLLWFRSARGELDLDHALRRPEPEALGDRYRWAVALALAALQAGRPAAAAGRADTWRALARELPNRFGRLLDHLADRVSGGDGPTPPELAGVAAAWPFAA